MSSQSLNIEKSSHRNVLINTRFYELCDQNFDYKVHKISFFKNDIEIELSFYVRFIWIQEPEILLCETK